MSWNACYDKYRCLKGFFSNLYIIINHHQMTASKQDLLSNHCYCIWHPYINRVKFYCVTGDIKKAFLRIQISEENRDAQRTVWYNNLADRQVAEYRFTTVIFGASPCQYNLGARCKSLYRSINPIVLKHQKPEALRHHKPGARHVYRWHTKWGWFSRSTPEVFISLDVSAPDDISKQWNLWIKELGKCNHLRNL